MVLLFDTNIILDFILKREPFYEASTKVINLCVEKNDVYGFIAFHSISNIFYILKPLLPDANLRKEVIAEITRFLTVVSCSHKQVCSLLQNIEVRDVEDGLQIECAKCCNANHIISRDIKDDFLKSPIPIISPADFIKEYDYLFK